jgi:hypothetical protein
MPVEQIQKIIEDTTQNFYSTPQKKRKSRPSGTGGGNGGKNQYSDRENSGAGKRKLLNMESLLMNRVVGQDHALKILSDAIVENRSGFNKPGQPIGSFFLLGPTGTGKQNWQNQWQNSFSTMKRQWFVLICLNLKKNIQPHFYTVRLRIRRLRRRRNAGQQNQTAALYRCFI